MLKKIGMALGAAAAALLPGLLPAADLEESDRVEYPANTVQEVAYLPWPSTPGFAVVARRRDSVVPGGVDGITFVRLSTPLVSPCQVTSLESVQDVEVFEGRIFATQQANNTEFGLEILDVDPVSCSGPPRTRVLEIPNGTSLAVRRWGSSIYAVVVNGRYRPTCIAGERAVYFYDVAGAQVRGKWVQGQDGFEPACDVCTPLCGPADVSFYQSPSGIVYMAVAAVQDGVYMMQLKGSTPADGFERIAHFTYTFDGVDEDGNPQPGRNGLPQDVAFTADGRYILTADQDLRGGPLIAWRTSDVWACDTPGSVPCIGEDVPKAGFWRAPGAPPGFAHKLLLDGPFLWLTYMDAGLRLLDIRDPEAPREIAWRDVLGGHPDCGYEGQWGAYGAALAPCDVLVTDVGAFGRYPGDPAPCNQPQLLPGALHLLHWEGESSVLEPMRISRTDTGLRATWERAPLAATYNLYAGTLLEMHDGIGRPYDHFAPATPDWCGQTCPSCASDLPDGDIPSAPFPEGGDGAYLLMRSRDACGRLGSLGEGTPGPRDEPLAGACP